MILEGICFLDPPGDWAAEDRDGLRHSLLPFQPLGRANVGIAPIHSPKDEYSSEYVRNM